MKVIVSILNMLYYLFSNILFFLGMIILEDLKGVWKVYYIEVKNFNYRRLV